MENQTLVTEEKTILTRIVNKHASLEDWNKSELVLKDGEIALAYVDTHEIDGTIVPTYFMKVGHGNKKFSELKYVAAPASDVHAWAKKEKLAESDLPDTFTNRVDVLEAEIENLTGNAGTSVANQIQAAIEALDAPDTAVVNQFVTAVAQEDGTITVTRRALTAEDIPTLTAAKISDFESEVNALIALEVSEREAADATLTAVVNSKASQDDFNALKGRVDVFLAAGEEGLDATLDTLSEIQKVIKDDVADAAALMAIVGEHTTDIDNLQAADIALDERIDALEAITHHTHDNKAVLDGINSNKVESWDSAATAKHIHGNQDVLDGITSGRVSDWDNALDEAKAYTNDEVNKVSAQLTNYVPTTRTINGQALSSDISLSYTHVGADQSGAAATAEENAEKYTDDAIDAVTAAYQRADSGLSERIDNIEDTYVKHSSTTIEYILDCGGCEPR